MTENPSDISAARGRIIRRGGSSTALAPAQEPTQGSVGRSSFSLPSFERLRDPIILFIIVPVLFCVSASISWSRPLLTDSGSVEAGEGAVHARFYDIGSELSERFSAPKGGVVMPPPQAQEARTIPTKRDPTEQSGVRAPKIDVVATHRDALEKQVYKILKKHGKPVQNGKDLAAAIVKEAIAQDYDPVFVAAVIKSESAFNALAKSNKGAQGLMQIMPRTGAWLAQQNALPRGKLTDPGHNLKLGITYLKQLEAEYKGNRMLTLVAYNWGPGHVESASSGSRRVPGEVMQYAVKILNDYRRWSSELRSSVG